MSETGLTQDGRATRRVTLITGASGGIGADLARVFARHGHDLALVARSRAKLESLADEIAASGRPRPLVLVFDLIEQGAATQIAAALEAAGATPESAVPGRPPASIRPNSSRSSISMSERSLK
jgi:uncharacterized protein